MISMSATFCPKCGIDTIVYDTVVRMALFVWTSGGPGNSNLELAIIRRYNYNLTVDDPFLVSLKFEHFNVC